MIFYYDKVLPSLQLRIVLLMSLNGP